VLNLACQMAMGATGFDWEILWAKWRAEVAWMASLIPTQGINCQQ